MREAIGNLFSIVKGHKAPLVSDRPLDGAYRYVQIEDLRPCSEWRYAKDDKGILASTVDILLTWDGANAGTVGWGLEGYAGSTIAILKPVSDKVHTPFFGYFLQSRFDALQANCSGATIPHINRSYLERLEIDRPPKPEQKRIAGILEKADRLINLRRYVRKLSNSYLRSVFLEMFGDPVTNPKGWSTAIISDVIASSQYGTSKASNAEEKGYPILGMRNLTYGGNLDLSSLSYVELSKKEFEELRLIPGDIIFNRTNSTELVGKTAVWRSSINAVLASYLVKLKLKNEVLPDYFVALLNSDYYKRLFQVRCRKAVGQSNISPTLLKELPMLRPPTPLQEKFSQIVQRFNHLQSRQCESERQAEHLFQTLLHKAFSGALN